MCDPCSFSHYLSSSQKGLKNWWGLHRNSNPDLCNASAALYQFSYQANCSNVLTSYIRDYWHIVYMSQSVSLSTTTTLNSILIPGFCMYFTSRKGLRKGDTIRHLVMTTQSSLNFIMQLCCVEHVCVCVCAKDAVLTLLQWPLIWFFWVTLWWKQKF